MSSTIIKVENLGKKYIIGHQSRGKYRTLREQMVHGLANVFSKTKRLVTGMHFPVLAGLQKGWRRNDDPLNRAGNLRTQRIRALLHLTRGQNYSRGSPHDEFRTKSGHDTDLQGPLDGRLRTIAWHDLLIETSCQRV